MLFDRSIEPSCSYCRFGVSIGFDEVACSKRGIMAGHGSCSSFRYEPTKREPEAPRGLRLTGLTEEDFSL